MSIKILHTADVHLGACFAFLGEKASEHRKGLLETFDRIVQLAKDRDINILLIAGDLFDSNKVSQYLVEHAKEKLRELGQSGIYTCILPGTHDALFTESIYFREQFQDLPRTYVFVDSSHVVHEYPDLDLAVWGKANTSNKSQESAFPTLPETFPHKFNVMMAHGSLQIEGKSAKDDWPVTFKEIASSRMDYIALGHWHGAQDVSQGRVTAWYAGSPEITYQEGKGGLGSGYVLFVELSKKEDGSHETKVEPIKVGSKDFQEEEIDASSFRDIAELKEKVAQDASPHLIKVVTLKGLLDPSFLLDLEALSEELRSKFFYLRIHNDTHVKIEDIEEDQYPKEMIIGQYVRILRDKIREAKDEGEKKLLEEVLQIGIAELEGRIIV